MVEELRDLCWFVWLAHGLVIAIVVVAVEADVDAVAVNVVLPRAKHYLEEEEKAKP